MSAPNGFIVLSTQRTGSHLLRSVVGSHPAFVHAGEVLIPGTPKPGSFDAFQADSARSSEPSRLWDEYLRHLQKHVSNARHVGFLVKYEHVDRVGGRDFTSDPIFTKVRVIHLVRRNILRMIASHHLAVARGVHVSHAPINHEINSVAVPADDVVNLLRKRAQMMAVFRDRLRYSPRSCEIAYEDIMNGDAVSDELILTLCGFFKVDDCFSRRPGTVQLGPRRLRDMISNYEAVASALRDTEFEGMLEVD